MKFTHGVWTMREGMSALPVARICRFEVEGDALVLYGVNRSEPRNNINNYGFVLRISSPFEGALRVRMSHRTGRSRRGPDFALEPQSGVAPKIRELDGIVEFESGSLCVRIALQPFTMEFRDGQRILTRSKPAQLAVMREENGQFHAMQRLSLGIGESVHGLGERFSPLVRNGQSLSIWNEDAGTETDLSYKSIPLYLTNFGYGIFVNTPGRVDFEVATERVYSVQFSVPDTELDYFVLAGPGPKGVLDKYTRLTGRPPLPPQWSFGLWLSTSFLTDYDEKTVGEMLDGMKEREIPVSVFHFDCLWMKEHHWCDFEWDEEKFPDPAGMLERLRERGHRVCVWINPYISEFSRLFPEARDKGFFLRDQTGAVYQRDDWQPQIALVDFTNPEAVRWYQDQLRGLLQAGVDCFKTDFGERIPEDAVYHDGSDPKRMHNYYAYLYNKTVYDLLVEERGEDDAVLFARSATAGCQKFPVHWGGDCDATFESMAETLRGGLSFGLSGGAFWSHDIGGFNDTASPALYKRWVAFGLLSSHSRLHGATSYRVPWAFDEEASEVLRHFCAQKMRLMPYLWRAAVQAHETGTPMLRAMVLEYPADPAAAGLETQYMLGDSLLVAPVFNDAGPVSFYIPQGRFTDYETGEVREGGRYYEEAGVDFFRTPLLVRPGTLLPVGRIADRPDYDYLAGLRLELFELADNTSAEAIIHGPHGERRGTFRATRTGSLLSFQATAGSGITVLLRNIFETVQPSNGEIIEIGGHGTLLAWKNPARELMVELAGRKTGSNGSSLVPSREAGVAL